MDRSIKKDEGERADLFLVRHGYAQSRAQAQEAIAAGKVEANGSRILKPSQKLRPGTQIAYRPAHPYASRGGVKLAAALDAFQLSPVERIGLDLGASAGGFTDVLLTRGAARVYAVDVGHGQLRDSIKSDPRVLSLEGVDARDLGPAIVPEPPEAVVADVSFISLTLALPAALALAAPSAWAVMLVKPQFELGRGAVPRSGVVRSEALRRRALDKITAWIGERGWSVIGAVDSPIAGGDGNREFLLAARKS